VRHTIRAGGFLHLSERTGRKGRDGEGIPQERRKKIFTVAAAWQSAQNDLT
jgi:hypothetical protein